MPRPYTGAMARKRIGEILLERRILTPEQLSQALVYQRQTGGRIGAALVAKGFVSEKALSHALGEALGLPVLDVVNLRDWPALQLLRAPFCERHDLFPVSIEDSRAGRRLLTVAMADPLNLPAIEQIEFTTGCKVAAVLAPRAEIIRAIGRYFHHRTIDPVVASESGRMTLVRPGGGEEIVETKTGARRPTRPPPLPVESDPLPLTEEVTSRTELAELMRSREKVKRPARPKNDRMAQDFEFLFGAEDPRNERLDDLERRFWALLRLMAKKGLLTKEEFLAEFDEPE
ncbi:MAG: GspE/PulE/PilB domain-containing protein [Deltaproteobacteria bacterium]